MIPKSALRRVSLILLVVLAYCGAPAQPVGASARPVGAPTSTPAKAASGAPTSAALTINRMTMWANSNGVIGYNPAKDGPGVVFPRGSSTVVSREGILWGGFVNDGEEEFLRIGGQSFQSATVPGRIVQPGVRENPSSPDVRIFRIRSDWATGDLRRDASDTYGIPDVLVTDADLARLRDQYKRDWLEWPWDKGAPYYERNGTPGYQPNPGALNDSVSDEPGLAGADQVLWFVANDLDSAAVRNLYGSLPIGLEMQVTCWAYNRPGRLGDVVYQKYRLIYKGNARTPANARIDAMVISKWVDADIGNYSDDYAGYDAPHQLGYAYNAEVSDFEFDKVGTVPSVVGYGLLQGPRVESPGSTAYWDGGMVDGYANQPVGSFTYLDGDVRNGDARLGDFRGLITMWYLMNGYEGVFSEFPECFIDPLTQSCTKFELTGDPETFAGWVDGTEIPKGDRRLLLSTSPFSLARGDTQEVVFALGGGVGTDNRSGIPRVRESVGAARDLFLVNFTAPATIPSPTVRPIELDDKIILDWESDAAALAAVESYSSRGFRFENFELFQLPLADSPFEDWVPLPAFNVLWPRFLDITHDYVRDRPLVNGQKYYFALRSRAFNPNVAFFDQRIYSAPVILPVTPHSPNPGVVYPYSAGEVVSDAYDIVGTNGATVDVTYYDPTRPDGHIYKILYHRSPSQLIDLFTKPWWDLVDSTAGDTLLRGISMDSAAARVVERGFTVECHSPPYGLKGVYETVSGGDSLRSPVFNQPNPGLNYMTVGAGSSYLDTILGGNPLDVDVELRFGDSSWSLMLAPTAPSSRWTRVPFTAWQTGVVSGDTILRQIYTVITGSGSDSLWRASVLLDREYNGQTLEEFYPLTIVSDSQRLGTGSIAGTYNDNIPWEPVEGPRVKGFLWVNGGTYSVKNAVWKVYFVDLDLDDVPAPPGTVVRFERYKLVRNGDEKVFTPASVSTNDVSAARQAVEKVNVFPNPYYGFNSAETDRFEHYITFSHLPVRAVIRIFNLGGDLVRTIEKDDASQFTTWDLNNHNGLPVGGGLFVAHIEMKDETGVDLGSKTLKLMIVPEQQTLQLR